MGLFLFILWMTISIYSILSNKDIFSPVKIYLLTIFVYFADLFLFEYHFEVYLTYLLYLMIALMLAALEAMWQKNHHPLRGSRTFMDSSRIKTITLIMWLLTLVPVSAQFYLFSYMGGFEQYLARLGFRVLEWQGLGPVTTAIRFINVISIFYFGIGLIVRMKKPGLWWVLYGCHFVIFLSLGLLSGSRGFLEIIFVMFMMYHYLRRTITVKAAVSIGLALFLFGTAIGIARSGFKMDDGKIITGFSYGEKERLKLRQGDYGIQPLELVYSQELKELQYGKTFLTVITNFVPRSWWPGKPDPGGLVLTKQFTGDAWGGASNLSTGMIAESILNFGYAGGIIVGSVLIFGSMLMMVLFYNRIRSTNVVYGDIRLLLIMIIYVFSIKTVAALVFMEFTNAFNPLFIHCILFYALYLLIKYKVTLFHTNTRLVTGTSK